MHEVDVKGILSAKNGMNLYRGCTHGCIYCDSRSKCYNMTHDFEDVEVKRNAPALLEDALRRKRKRCMIGTGAMSDPYMPCEERYGLTRASAEIIERYGFGFAVQTKSDRVLRDLPLLRAIGENAKCVVQMTLTTADEALCRVVEPNVCGTARRAETLAVLRDNGIPTVVWLSPFLPFLNDTEENVRALLRVCAETNVRGILCFGIGMTLREGDREYYYAALDRHFPGLRARYERTYGSAYEVTSPNHARLMRIVTDECARCGILCGVEEVFDYLHAFPERDDQMTFF